jgi:two-component system NtrC family response regulator
VLVTHFLELIGRSSVQIDAEALDVMRHYNWPGNVRQLRNAIEIAALTAGDSRVITRADIEQRAGISEDDILLSPPRTLAQARALAERNLTIESHRRHKGDKSKMAEEMEVSRMTIYNLIRRHCLGRDELDGPGTDADNDSHGAERQSV